MAPLCHGVVLIAHGSRNSEANQAHLHAVDKIQRSLTGQAIVRPGFLELSSPTIGEAIDEVVEAGAMRILVVPHFLYPGRHVSEHIPEMVAECSQRHSDVVIQLAPSTGESPAMVELVATIVRAGLESAEQLEP